MLKWEILPAEVKEKMLENQYREYGFRDETIFIEDITAMGDGFYWSGSPEGGSFWRRVILFGKLDVFYQKYPLKTHIKIDNCVVDLKTLKFTKV